MAERFSQKNLRVRPSSEEEKIVTNAKKHFEKTLVEISGELVGSVAALEHPTKNKKLNYGEIFLRDNVPVMIYLITQKRYEIVKRFLMYVLNYKALIIKHVVYSLLVSLKKMENSLETMVRGQLGGLLQQMQVYGGQFYVGIMSIKAVIMPSEKVKAFKEVFNFY